MTIMPAQTTFVPEPDAARPPACLYAGDVMHQRMKPVGHRFRYRVYSLLIDLDRLDEADRLSPLFSVNGANVASFHEADHLRGADQPSLRAHVDALLAEAGLEQRAARIELACYPRIFGQVFNPLSVYYAYDDAGQPLALVYEVRNTFGDWRAYLLDDLERDGTVVRATHDKDFHVSPFLPVEGLSYRFTFRPPPLDGRGTVAVAMQVSTYSLKTLADAFVPLMDQGGSLVGLDFDNQQAWPAYNWMGVAKSALQSVSRYLAR